MEMEVVVERCAFLDVHRDTAMACARTPDGHGGRREEVRQFGTTTGELPALSDWLVERRISLVGMEATGVYWTPVHWVLDATLPEVWVINARHMRNLPGRKTDVADAVGGASLLEHGLVRPSFDPNRSFQYKFPEPLWDRLRAYLINMRALPLWVNRNLSATVFGGRQTSEFWRTIFLDGETPQGQQVLVAPLNIMEMIKEPDSST